MGCFLSRNYCTNVLEMKCLSGTSATKPSLIGLHQFPTDMVSTPPRTCLLHRDHDWAFLRSVWTPFHREVGRQDVPDPPGLMILTAAQHQGPLRMGVARQRPDSGGAIVPSPSAGGTLTLPPLLVRRWYLLFAWCSGVTTTQGRAV